MSECAHCGEWLTCDCQQSPVERERSLIGRVVSYSARGGSANGVIVSVDGDKLGIAALRETIVLSASEVDAPRLSTANIAKRLTAGEGHLAGSPVGKIVRYDWPGSGVVTAVITAEYDDDTVGLVVLTENTRVPTTQVEEL